MLDFSEARKNYFFFYSMTEYELEHAHAFTRKFVKLTNKISDADAFLLWGLRENSPDFIALAESNGKPLFYFEDGFLRSIFTAWADVADDLKSGISFTVDTKSPYFNASTATDLEVLLNNYNLTSAQALRARRVISKIIENRLSKYNNQRLICPIYGNRKNKVLIVDQSFQDASITYGKASANAFVNMLEDALKFNPDHDILIKVHPDTIAQNKKSEYFKELHSLDRVFLIYDEVNPIALLEQVTKVYVSTSQLGFEALLCGKEVYTYGMPFYAGWGLTKDNIKCERRVRKRSLEDVFFIAYILYSYYIDPRSGTLCEIEDAVDYLIERRAEWFRARLP